MKRTFMKKMITKKIVTLLLLLPCLYIHPLLAQPELKGSPEELRSFLYPRDNMVTIQAEAEEKAYANKAVISLMMTTEDKQLSQAIAANQALRGMVIQSLLQAGIDPKNIKNAKFSSTPEYFWFGQKPSSHKVMNRVVVSVVQEKHLQDVAVVADQYKDVTLADTTFEHVQKDQYQQKVREQALAKIMEQKAFYEQSLGIQLTAVDIITSRTGQQGTPGALGLKHAMRSHEKQHAASRVASVQDAATELAQMAEHRQHASFDEISYQANLAVRFKITQAR